MIKSYVLSKFYNTFNGSEFWVRCVECHDVTNAPVAVFSRVYHGVFVYFWIGCM